MTVFSTQNSVLATKIRVWWCLHEDRRPNVGRVDRNWTESGGRQLFHTAGGFVIIIISG